jgi:hypothetical protein
MERAGTRDAMGWGARLLIALVLILAGAAAATWGLAHYQRAAKLFGVTASAPAPQQPKLVIQQVPQQQQPANAGTLNPAIAEQIGQLQARLQRVESESQEVRGTAGRADALLIAFAARRAIERGVGLGYLEPLLLDRFGADHSQAVATIVTGSRAPVRLTVLIAQYQDLPPQLLGPAPNEGIWAGIKRSFSSLVTVHRSDRPSTAPRARFDRALSYLMAGEVDSALAETMRLPGAARAGEWINSARRYIAVHRALDEIESAAMVGSSRPG